MGNNIQKYVIIKDRAELYEDFVINLLYFIDYYYLDPESLSKDVDIRNHYMWCYNKTNDQFKEQGIDFGDNEELKEYFFKYYYHQFYKPQYNPTQILDIKYFEKFWNDIFDIHVQKNKNITNIFIEIYNIFDKSINHKKIF